MTETSLLEAFIRRCGGAWDAEAYKLALASDWVRGREEQIADLDPDGAMGTIATQDGFVGYIGTTRHDGAPLSEFRSIAKNGRETWRHVFAKDPGGRVWYVGKLKRQTIHSAQIEVLRQPLPNQAEIDRESAVALVRALTPQAQNGPG